MSSTEYGPCDFCGTEAISNTKICSENIVYIDGPPEASVPNIVLCYDCAEEVTDYLKAFSETPDEETRGLSPIGEAEAEALLDRLVNNKHLVVRAGKRARTYGIRFVDGEWKRATEVGIGRMGIRTLDRGEVKDILLKARRVTLKHLNQSTWERFERDY